MTERTLGLRYQPTIKRPFRYVDVGHRLSEKVALRDGIARGENFVEHIFILDSIANDSEAEVLFDVNDCSVTLVLVHVRDEALFNLDYVKETSSNRS